MEDLALEAPPPREALPIASEGSTRADILEEEKVAIESMPRPSPLAIANVTT